MRFRAHWRTPGGGALAVFGFLGEGTTEHRIDVTDVRRFYAYILHVVGPTVHLLVGVLALIVLGDSRFQSRLKSPDGDGGLTTLVAAALHRPRAGEPTTAPSAST